MCISCACMHDPCVRAHILYLLTERECGVLLVRQKDSLANQVYLDIN